MGNNYAGLYLIIALLLMYIIGSNLPDKKVGGDIGSIGKPPIDNTIIGYDYKKGEWKHTEEDNKDYIDLGPRLPKQVTERTIYVEDINSKKMTKREFDYMVEDYIRDNYDDLMDQFGSK